MQLALAYPIRLICQVLGYPRSSYYYQPSEGDDLEYFGHFSALSRVT